MIGGSITITLFIGFLILIFSISIIAMFVDMFLSLIIVLWEFTEWLWEGFWELIERIDDNLRG